MNNDIKGQSEINEIMDEFFNGLNYTKVIVDNCGQYKLTTGEIVYWVKINANAYKAPILNWCAENLMSSYSERYRIIYFTDKADYVMFILRWGE